MFEKAGNLEVRLNSVINMVNFDRLLDMLEYSRYIYPILMSDKEKNHLTQQKCATISTFNRKFLL